MMKNLQGNFDLSANNFDVSDFMEIENQTTDSISQKETRNEQLKIPSFLDCTINASATKCYL